MNKINIDLGLFERLKKRKYSMLNLPAGRQVSNKTIFDKTNCQKR